MSAGRDQGYLCEGIAEELINALTQVPGLRVTARSSSFALRSADGDARTIGQRLGVDAVLEGGVRKAGDRLRVTVQLVEVEGGSPRWSHRFDGSLEQVFEIQDEIAASVATTLRGMLSTEERDALRRPETRAEAYEHFLRGRQLLRTLKRVSISAAEREFLRAIEIDPGYAPAHAGLSQVHSWRVEWMGGGDDEKAAADASSRRALQLGPGLAESHVARGDVLSMKREYEAAELAYQEAVRLNPASFEAYYRHARTCFQSGKLEESIALFRRAAEVCPEDFQCLLLAEMPLRKLGRFDEGVAVRREGLRRVERQLELDPNDARALILGAGGLLNEDRAKALDWAARAVALAPDEPSVTVNAACTYARIGRKEEALALLAETFGRGYGKRDWIENDPDYDSLRDDPRFQAMMAALPR
jgi:TolB-like protein/tetratricopeptide (TPR) repeat protein